MDLSSLVTFQQDSPIKVKRSGGTNFRKLLRTVGATPIKMYQNEASRALLCSKIIINSRISMFRMFDRVQFQGIKKIVDSWILIRANALI